MKRIQKTGFIPKFGLYGEASQKQPGFIHIENIAARSRHHDWIIKPHRHGKLVQLLCLYDGDAEVRIDDSDHHLSGNWVISIPPGVVHGFCFRTDTEGVVLTLQETGLLRETGQLQSAFEDLFDAPRLIGFEDDDERFTQLRQQLLQIRIEFDKNESGQDLMLGWLAKMVLMTLKRQLEHSQLQGSDGSGGKHRLLLRFRSLVDENYRNHWKVQDYAQALHTSTSSLNRLCLERIGVTAKTIVQERLLMEIKRRLIYTREPLDSAAYSLGFKDPSYFSRFFKKHEGRSPSEYRRARYFETGTT